MSEHMFEWGVEHQSRKDDEWRFTGTVYATDEEAIEAMRQRRVGEPFARLRLVARPVAPWQVVEWTDA